MDAVTPSKVFQERSLIGSYVLSIKKPNGRGAFVIFLFLLYMIKTFHFKKANQNRSEFQNSEKYQKKTISICGDKPFL